MNNHIWGVGIAGTVALFFPLMSLIKKISDFFINFWSSDNAVAYVCNRMPISPLTRYLTKRARVESLAKNAGVETSFSYDRILAYKEIVFWATVVGLFLFYVTKHSGQDIALVGLAGLFLALFWPELWLLRLGALDKKQATRQLPRAIDLMQVYGLAGSNLEQAIGQAGKHLPGVWGEVFAGAYYRLSVGVPFAEAFTERAFQLDADFRKFFMALKLARQLGVSISQTLEVQSALLRSRHRQETEEAARKASVHIALPLVLCIFPALLIIYLAPAILNVMYSL